VTEPLVHAQLEWAQSYDGYQRLASTPDKLERLLRSARNSFRAHGAVPDWCGVDLLRGWAFYLAGPDHQAGGDTLGDDWQAVLKALADHPDAGPADRPPGAPTTKGSVSSTMSPKLPTGFSSSATRQRRGRCARVALGTYQYGAVRIASAATRRRRLTSGCVSVAGGDRCGAVAQGGTQRRRGQGFRVRAEVPQRPFGVS